jgi:hypothetical protein
MLQLLKREQPEETFKRRPIVISASTLGRQSQSGLRCILESTQASSAFILVVTDLNLLDPAIKSRSTVVYCATPEDKVGWVADLRGHLPSAVREALDGRPIANRREYLVLKGLLMASALDKLLSAAVLDQDAGGVLDVAVATRTLSILFDLEAVGCRHAHELACIFLLSHCATTTEGRSRRRGTR